MKTKTKKINQTIVNKIVKQFNGKKEIAKHNKDCKRIEFNKIVHFDKETNEIEVLDGVFEYKDGMRGATGSRFTAISKEEYKERTNKENVIDSIMDCGFENDLFKREGANGVYKAMKANNEIESFMFDLSYRELWDYLRKELKLNKTNAFIFECTGGGRMFDKDYQGNINPELSEIIREYEG